MSKLVEYLESVISENQKGIIPFILRFLLLLISYLVLGIVKIRRWLYSCGTIKIERLPCKVISVGNVVVGGSGKTPAVIAIANLIRAYSNQKIAIISRGYKSKIKGNAVVSDGSKILLDPYKAGDEPYLIANSLLEIPVLIGKDRIKSGMDAIKRWGTQIIILDDGFQYLKLFRDVNIVTIDSTSPFGLNHILPRGYLREPLSVLRNADAIILTRVNQCKNLNVIRQRLDILAPSIPIFESIHAPISLKNFNTEEYLDLIVIKDHRILAVCGIANHLSFIDTLKLFKPLEITSMAYSDHHEYSPKDISAINQKAKLIGAEMIITTEKDAPKLKKINICPMYVLKIELKLDVASTDKFLDLIGQKCNL